MTQILFAAKNSDGALWYQQTDIPSVDFSRLAQAIVVIDHLFRTEGLTRCGYKVGDEKWVLAGPEDKHGMMFEERLTSCDEVTDD